MESDTCWFWHQRDQLFIRLPQLLHLYFIFVLVFVFVFVLIQFFLNWLFQSRCFGCVLNQTVRKTNEHIRLQDACKFIHSMCPMVHTIKLVTCVFGLDKPAANVYQIVATFKSLPKKWKKKTFFIFFCITVVVQSFCVRLLFLKKKTVFRSCSLVSYSICGVEDWIACWVEAIGTREHIFHANVSYYLELVGQMIQLK